MNNRIGHILRDGKRLFVTARGILTVTVPIAIGVVSGTIQAQALRFEVVSIHPIKEAPGRNGGGGLRYRPGFVESRPQVTAKQLIMEAYHVTTYQISGGPRWLDSDAFSLEAKASPGTIDAGCEDPGCPLPPKVR